jgi:hypothetical protein
MVNVIKEISFLTQIKEEWGPLVYCELTFALISKKILNDFVTIIQMSTSMWIYCTDRIIFWMSSANCMTHYSYFFDKINDTSLTMVYRYFFSFYSSHYLHW